MENILVIERPLRREVLLDRVQERGIHVGGAKPVNSIGSYLSTDPRFRNAGRGIWTLTEEPEEEPQPEHHPDGGYNNGHQQDRPELVEVR